MTRRPPPRHRLRHRTRRRRAVDSLLVTAAILAVTAAGNAMAPRPRVETVPNLPVAAGHTDTRVSRYEREALLPVTEASAVVELATTTPTRACRCSPREPLVTAQAPTAQNAPANALSASRTAPSPSGGLPVPSPTPSEAPSATETVAPTTTAPTTTPPETTEPTSAPDTSSETTTETATTEVALLDGTEPTVTEESEQ